MKGKEWQSRMEKEDGGGGKYRQGRRERRETEHEVILTFALLLYRLSPIKMALRALNSLVFSCPFFKSTNIT